MNDKIKALAEAIIAEKRNLLKEIELFGEEHDITIRRLYKIFGMEEAFAIIAEQDFTDYILDK